MLFAPIGRYKYIIYSLLFYITFSTYHSYQWFIDENMSSLFWTISIGVLILLTLIYKRLSDIFNKKAIAIFCLISIFAIYGLFTYAHFLILKYSKIYDLVKNMTNLFTILNIFNIILFLFLSIKKGKNSSPFQMKKFITRTLIICTVSICHQVLLSNFYTTFEPIPENMYPSLEINDRLLITKTNKYTKLERGDIIYNKNFDNYQILRIIGLPEEKVELKGTNVYINGILLKDDFAFYGYNLKPINFNKKINIPKDHYLLMGDNRYYTKNGEMKILQKNKKYIWKSLSSFTRDIYQITHKDDIAGKVIGIHYCRLDKKKSKYVFSLNGSKFGFYPGKAFAKMYGLQSKFLQ